VVEVHASPETLPELQSFLSNFQVRFRRAEARAALERYTTGLLTELPNKNCDTIAMAVPGTSSQRAITESGVQRWRGRRTLLGSRNHQPGGTPPMGNHTRDTEQRPEGVQDTLTALLRQGAQQLIRQAVEAELEELLAQYAGQSDGKGRAGVVRNGYLPEREVLTGVGPVPVRVPKVRSRLEEPVSFRSSLVPPYVRRAKTVDAALPWLYLKGISTGQMQEAQEVLVGPEAKGLSAPVVSRLKKQWQEEYGDWRRRSLDQDRWIYLWADGVYSGLRAERQRLCLLVIIGLNQRGEKHFLAIEDGVRESTQSWREVLLDLKARGLQEAPAVGDGALGFWAALEEVFPTTRHQRCWVHKTANVLNYLPRSVQPRAKAALHEIWMAPTRATAEGAFDQFVQVYEAK
jgi:putative transposase